MKALFASLFVVALSTGPAAADTISVPCFNGGGSGGWMFGENVSKKYFPVVIIGINQWKPGMAKEHPDYDPAAPWNKYGTCAIVPSHE